MKLYLLTWRNDGSDRGEDLFDRELTKEEQHAYMQSRYGADSPDVSEWISWDFGPISIQVWPRKDLK